MSKDELPQASVPRHPRCKPQRVLREQQAQKPITRVVQSREHPSPILPAPTCLPASLPAPASSQEPPLPSRPVPRGTQHHPSKSESAVSPRAPTCILWNNCAKPGPAVNAEPGVWASSPAEVPGGRGHRGQGDWARRRLCLQDRSPGAVSENRALIAGLQPEGATAPPPPQPPTPPHTHRGVVSEKAPHRGLGCQCRLSQHSSRRSGPGQLPALGAEQRMTQISWGLGTGHTSPVTQHPRRRRGRGQSGIFPLKPAQDGAGHREEERQWGRNDLDCLQKVSVPGTKEGGGGGGRRGSR